MGPGPRATQGLKVVVAGGDGSWAVHVDEQVDDYADQGLKNQLGPYH